MSFITPFHYASEGMIVTNDQGDIIEINPSAAKMFGYEKDELKGSKIEQLIPKKYRERHVSHRSNFTKNPHSRPMGTGFDLYGCRKDGSEFPVEVSLSPYSTTEGRFILGFIIDITERKNAEERLRNYSSDLEREVEKRTLVLKEAIQELEKTKSDLNDALTKEKDLNDLKSRFVSMASHEFRTPLATILSSLSLLEMYMEQGNSAKQLQHIEKIGIYVKNLIAILNDMLSLSKLEEGKIPVSAEVVDVEKFIGHSVEELRMVARSGQELKYEHEGSHTELFTDKNILHHIFVNLVSNAIKFSPEDAPIMVKTESSKGNIYLTVQDFGIGIPKEDQKNLFERFFRGSNANTIQGTGLGLNIVARYVELIGGKINFESRVNEGTKFIVTIGPYSATEKTE